jgi:hypothetical protein
MCNTCNGTGGIHTEHSWGLQIQPCPSTNCNVNDRLREESIAYVQHMLKELRGRESA